MLPTPTCCARSSIWTTPDARLPPSYARGSRAREVDRSRRHSAGRTAASDLSHGGALVAARASAGRVEVPDACGRGGLARELAARAAPGRRLIAGARGPETDDTGTE